MARTKTIRVSEEELIALQALRKQGKAAEVAAEVKAEEQKSTISDAQKELTAALVEAINQTKPIQKKTILNRKPNTPWTPKNGEPRVKMKRKFYHHGLLIGENVSNDEISLLNKVKPGVYCDGYVRVTLRKDRGIDIDHPVRTAAQRLRLVNQYGIRNFSELLKRVIDEKENPQNYRRPEDADLYDLES